MRVQFLPYQHCLNQRDVSRVTNFVIGKECQDKIRNKIELGLFSYFSLISSSPAIFVGISPRITLMAESQTTTRPHTADYQYNAVNYKTIVTSNIIFGNGTLWSYMISQQTPDGPPLLARQGASTLS